MTAEWHYIGHYGQQGPFTREQIDELIEGGVIGRDTYVWRGGMTDWIYAEQVPELNLTLRKADPYAMPPPPPSPTPYIGGRFGSDSPSPRPFGQDRTPAPSPHYVPFPAVRSDKSRTIGGVLQFFPGFGRIYLGYAAIGILQLILFPCGVGIVWSWIDGIIILAGGVRMDGYGRQLNE